MSFLTCCFDRAYINLPPIYDEAKEIFHSLNMTEMIIAVAKANPSGDGIVQKTKAFILGMPERFSVEENMATFVSLRQLKNLIKSFEHDKNVFENNPDDQLAEFFYGCYDPICKAIGAGNIALQNSQLPPVPRNHPQDEG